MERGEFVVEVMVQVVEIVKEIVEFEVGELGVGVEMVVEKFELVVDPKFLSLMSSDFMPRSWVIISVPVKTPKSVFSSPNPGAFTAVVELEVVEILEVVKPVLEVDFALVGFANCAFRLLNFGNLLRYVGGTIKPLFLL